MPAVDQQNVTLWNEKVVIFDVSGKISIGMIFHRIGHKRNPCPTTKRDFLNFTTCQSRMAQTRRADCFGHKVQKLKFIHRFFKFTDHACSTKIR